MKLRFQKLRPNVTPAIQRPALRTWAKVAVVLLLGAGGAAAAMSRLDATAFPGVAGLRARMTTVFAPASVAPPTLAPPTVRAPSLPGNRLLPTDPGAGSAPMHTAEAFPAAAAPPALAAGLAARFSGSAATRNTGASPVSHPIGSAPARPPASIAAPSAAGQTLIVDEGTTYTVPAAGDTYADVIVAVNNIGTINHSVGTLTITGNGNPGDHALILGQASGFGTYKLSGSGSLSAPFPIIGANDYGVFNQSGGTFTTNGTALVIASVSGTGIYNLNGGTLTTGSVAGGTGASTFSLGGGTLQAGASSTTFFHGLTTANVQTGGAMIDSNGYNITISQILRHDTTGGAPALDGGLAKNGLGTLNLTGANTYTGPTTVTAGMLSISTIANGLAASPLGASSNDASNLVLNGGTLAYTGATATTDRGLTVNAGGALNVTAGSTLTLTGAVVSNGNGLLTLNGPGNVILGGTADNNNLGVMVNAGTLVLAKSPSSGNPGVHAIGGNGLTINGGTAQLGGPGGDQIYDAAGVVVNGGTFDLNGASETIGALNGTGGTVTNTSASVTPTLTVTGGGAFAGTFGTTGNGLSLTVAGAGQTLTLSGSTDNGYLSATVSTGTLVLAKTSSSGVHAVGGGLTINGGTVQLAGSGGDQIYDASGVAINSGTFDLNGTSETIFSLNGTGGTVTNTSTGTASTLTMGSSSIAGSGTGTYGGVLASGAGTLALVKNGTGTFTLTGVNTFTGGTTLNAGLLVLGDGTDAAALRGFSPASGSGAPGTAAITVSDGSFQVSADATVSGGRGAAGQAGSGVGATAVVFAGSGTLANNGAINGGNGGAAAGAGTSGRAGGSGVAFAASGGLINAGTISGGFGGTSDVNSGGGGFGVSVSGVASLTNSGTINGGGGGTANNSTSGAGGAGVSFSSGGTLTNSGTVSGGNGGPEGGSVAVGTGGTGVNFSAGGSLTNSGTIAGGSGGIIFSGGNGVHGSGVVFSGAAGTLENDQGGAISNGVVMGNFANTVTLQIGSTITGGLIVGTSTAATLTLTDSGTGGSQIYSTAAASTTFAGSLTKNGTGTWTLDQPMTYSAGTTVNTGTLLAGNPTGSATGSGAVSVRNGATLGGNGTISGTVTVQGGGTLAPGAAAISRLTVGGGLSLQVGSLLTVTLGGTTAGSYDQVVVGGQLTLAGSLQVRTANGFTLAPGMTFTIIDDTGSTATTTGFSNTVAGTLYTDAAGDTFLVNNAGNSDGGLLPNDVTLTVLTVVPEPSTWTLLGLGGVGVLGLTLCGRRPRVA